MSITFSRIFFFSLFIFIPFLSEAQVFSCTTHEMTNAILEREPEKRALLEQLEREAQEYTREHYGERGGNIKVIPTVIHIIHDNGSENLSKQTILNSLNVVNQELRAQNGTIGSVVSQFQGIIGDTEFELRLAKIDANGNCTDGITRTVSSQTYAANDDVKDLVNWNDGSRRYLQVWLVNSVGSGAGGYTYLPGTTNSHNNGIIIRAAQFQGSLAHEFGHWMNLRHTWGGTNEPGIASNCNDDDGVNDTPNTIGVSGACNVNQETCGTLDNVQNHMDYSSCARMFTSGQAARMQSASNSTTGGRNTYWSSGNRSSTGTSDGFSNSCVPNIDFSLDNAVGCEGLEVDFSDNSWGADVDASWVWNWSFPGGTPASSSELNPTIVYNTAGTYPATLSITTAAGSQSYTMPNAVVVNQLGGGINEPYLEGMEASNFPNNSNPDMVWEIQSAGGLTWQRNTTASFSGNASVRINLRSITSGDVNSLISPPIDMSNVASADASMTFRLAHSNRTSTTHSERLRIYASKNCGETWSLRYTQDGNNLNTAGGLSSSTFVPTASQWRLETVSLVPFAGEEHVLIRFEALSDQQSYLYIDDININGFSTANGIEETGVFEQVQLYPNPVNDEAFLEISVKESTSANIRILNVMGQQVHSLQQRLALGLNRLSLGSELSELKAGIYLLRVKSENGMSTIRFVKD